MIVVLSCFDLVAVVTIYPGILLYLITWLREDYYFLSATTVYLLSSSVFLPFSFCVLLVMNIERYLGAYYPFFHRTSVTRGRLLTLLAILLISTVVTYLISANGLVIRGRVFLMILLALFLPPFMFVNFKLFTIARKVKREQAVSPVPGERPTLNLKNISTGLWAVACLMLLHIPFCFHIASNFAEKSTHSNIFLRLGFHICHHEWNIEQFELFLKEQGFTHRRNKDTNIKTLNDRLLGS